MLLRCLVRAALFTHGIEWPKLAADGFCEHTRFGGGAFAGGAQESSFLLTVIVVDPVQAGECHLLCLTDYVQHTAE